MKKLTKNQETVIAIKQRLKNGIKPIEVAKALNVSHQLVYKWKNKKDEPRKPKKTKLNQKYLNIIKEWAEGKSTGVEMASSRKITRKLEHKYNVKVCHSTVDKALNSMLSRPRKVRKVFFLNDDHLQQRKDFCDYLLEVIRNLKNDSCYLATLVVF